MRLHTDPPVHLTYCLNIHPGERWPEVFDAIQTYPERVRRQVMRNHPGLAWADRSSVTCPSSALDGSMAGEAEHAACPFGLGLRMSKAAASDLQREGGLGALRYFLECNRLYPFTINGFPYGTFHGQAVKTAVYQPDWRDPARRDYTCQLADILSVLLPTGGEGSISTVPCAYGGKELPNTDLTAIVQNLMQVVIHLERLCERTHKTIHVGLEPEPDCYLERTRDCVEFFAGPLRDIGIPYLVATARWTAAEAERRIAAHLGVCFDTCHLAVWYEDLAASVQALRNAGIRISKVQLSSALETTWVKGMTDAVLTPFCDRVYLHQAKVRDTRDGHITGYRDLPDLLAAGPGYDGGQEVRIHFHVPLYWDGRGALRSTHSMLTREFFDAALAAGVTHWEIETYTFDVLPPELRAMPVEESIAREYDWTIRRMIHGG